MENIARPGHVRIVVAGDAGKKTTATACGAPQSARDVLHAELPRVQKLDWPICKSCLAALAQFRIKPNRVTRKWR